MNTRIFRFENMQGGPLFTNDDPFILNGRVFYRGVNDDLREYSINAGIDESWDGTLTSGPSVVETKPSQFDVFVRDASGTVSSRERIGGAAPQPWGQLSGSPTIVGAPVAISRELGKIDLFVRGADDALWTVPFDGVWGSWSNLGGPIRSAPTVISKRKENLSVYVLDGSMTISAIEKNGPGPWGPFVQLATAGTTFTGNPVATFRQGLGDGGPTFPLFHDPSQADVWARTSQNHLYNIFRKDGEVWSAGVDLGGVLQSDVSVFNLRGAVVVNLSNKMSISWGGAFSDFSPALDPSDPWVGTVAGAPAIEKAVGPGGSFELYGVVRALSDNHMVLFHFREKRPE